MKAFNLFILVAIAVAFSACDSPEMDHPERGPRATGNSTSTTTTSETVQRPPTDVGTTTTVQHY